MGEFRYVGLGVLLAKAHAAQRRTVAREAERLRSAADADAPKRTGTLSGGIHTEIEGTTATVSTGAETHPGEAFYEEIGSEHNAATDYMQRAVHDSITSLPKTLAEEARAEF